jgi:hypothetical protein
LDVTAAFICMAELSYTLFNKVTQLTHKTNWKKLTTWIWLHFTLVHWITYVTSNSYRNLMILWKWR